jgi:hypothetical protein
MRLIRITKNDADVQFDGSISADVNIESGSKMCIEGLSLGIKEADIEIPGGSGLITYTQGTKVYSVDVARSEPYTTTNGSELIDAITDGLNENIIYYPANADPQNAITIGMEFRASITNAGKVAFQAFKGTVGELKATGATAEWESSAGINVPPAAAPNQIAWGVNVPVPDGECRPSLIQLPIPRGSAYMETTIYDAVKAGGTSTTPDRNGVWLCYTTKDLSALPVEQLRAELETDAGRIKYCNYGVGATILAANQIQATTIINGVAAPLGAPTTTAVVLGDIKNPRIRLDRSGKKIYATTWNVDAAAISQNIGDDVLTTQELYQFLVFWDRDTYIEISQVQACIGPFANDTIASFIPEGDADLGVGSGVAIKPIYFPPQGINATYNLYQPDYARTANHLTFPNTDVASYLGYNSVRVPISGSRSGINFSANASYRYGPRLLTDTIIVLSDTIPLVSYDTTRTNNDGEGQQRSILAVVPVSSANAGSVSYKGNEMWLDIRNNQPMTLRNLRFRLVDGAYLPLETIGQASLVILVKGPKE